MITNRPKAELIIELCGLQQEQSIKKVLKLIEILVQEARADNDTAESDTFRLNQGEIRGYLKLKDMIERGLPATNK